MNETATQNTHTHTQQFQIELLIRGGGVTKSRWGRRKMWPGLFIAAGGSARAHKASACVCEKSISRNAHTTVHRRNNHQRLPARTSKRPKSKGVGGRPKKTDARAPMGFTARPFSSRQGVPCRPPRRALHTHATTTTAPLQGRRGGAGAHARGKKNRCGGKKRIYKRRGAHTAPHANVRAAARARALTYA